MLRLFVCLFFLQVFSGTAFAQSDSTKKYLNLVVKTDLLLDAANGLDGFNSLYYSITVEKMIGKQGSLQFSCYGAHKLNSFGHNNFFVISPEYKYFVSKKRKFAGYYVGVGVKSIHFVEVIGSWTPPQTLSGGNINTNIEQKTTIYGIGLINGVQFYLCKRLTLDALLGYGIISRFKLFSEYPYQVNRYSDFRAAINLGYRF